MENCNNNALCAQNNEPYTNVYNVAYRLIVAQFYEAIISEVVELSRTY